MKKSTSRGLILTPSIVMVKLGKDHWRRNPYFSYLCRECKQQFAYWQFVSSGWISLCCDLIGAMKLAVLDPAKKKLVESQMRNAVCRRANGNYKKPFFFRTLKLLKPLPRWLTLIFMANFQKIVAAKRSDRHTDSAPHTHTQNLISVKEAVDYYGNTQTFYPNFENFYQLFCKFTGIWNLTASTQYTMKNRVLCVFVAWICVTCIYDVVQDIRSHYTTHMAPYICSNICEAYANRPKQQTHTDDCTVPSSLADVLRS